MLLLDDRTSSWAWASMNSVNGPFIVSRLQITNKKKIIDSHHALTCPEPATVYLQLVFNFLASPISPFRPNCNILMNRGGNMHGCGIIKNHCGADQQVNIFVLLPKREKPPSAKAFVHSYCHSLIICFWEQLNGF